MSTGPARISQTDLGTSGTPSAGTYLDHTFSWSVPAGGGGGGSGSGGGLFDITMGVPRLSTFTTVDPTSIMTFTENPYRSLNMKVTGLTPGSANVQGLARTVPSTPYNVATLMGYNGIPHEYFGIVFGFRESSSGKLDTLVCSALGAYGPAQYLHQEYSDPMTRFNNTQINPVGINDDGKPQWFHLEDDGTNVTFGVSSDGANPFPILTFAKSGGYLTTYDQIFIGLLPEGSASISSTGMSVTCFCYDEDGASRLAGGSGGTGTLALSADSTTVIDITSLTVSGDATLTNNGSGSATLNLPPRLPGMARFYDPGDVTSWTWENQTALGVTATTTYYAGALNLHIPAPATTGTDNRHLLLQSLPSPPWTITAGFHGMTYPVNYYNYGIAVYNSSSGKHIGFTPFLQQGSATPVMALIKYANTSQGGTGDGAYISFANQNGIWLSGVIWYRVTDDGTTRNFYFSNTGVVWMLVYSVASSDYGTMDMAGFYVNPVNSSSPYDTNITLVSWHIDASVLGPTTPA